MIAMVEKIIAWLKTHENDLQDIDYADDVELDFGECGYGNNETFESFIRALNIVESENDLQDINERNEVHFDFEEGGCRPHCGKRTCCAIL